MKSTIIALAMLAITGSALADIPVRTEGVSSYVYGGQKAADKFEAINSNVIAGNSSGWSGEAQSYKVERAADGLSQTICTKNFNYRDTSKAPTFSCVATKSTNGKPVPAFKAPPRRLG